MGDLMTPPIPAQTELAKPRILSPTAGIRVSPYFLGAMSVGEAWKDTLGVMDKEQSFKLLDAFVAAGGNAIDTANNYQNEESEKWVGEWMKARGNRDSMVIATKYTTQYRSYELGKSIASNNFGGNSRRSMHVSIRDSLKKLQTDWIDIFYVHWWDWTTSIEEVMDSLHILVEQGKVLYLGASDMPAWVVAQANTYAKAHGKTPFSIYQGRWNIMLRDFEREIIPMARQFGMALAPWDVMGSGKFQTKQAIEERKAKGEILRSLFSATQTEQEIQISNALAKVAEEHGIESVTAIALAYVMAKAKYVFPIIGGRKVEHLHDNIKALSIRLTNKQIKYLESIVPFDIGFPMNMLGDDPREGEGEFGFMGAGQHFHLQFQKSGKPVGY